MEVVLLDTDNFYVSFDKDGPEIIIHVRFMAWHNEFKQPKTHKKGITKELIKKDISKDSCSMAFYKVAGLAIFRGRENKEWNQFLMIKLVDYKIWCVSVVYDLVVSNHIVSNICWE